MNSICAILRPSRVNISTMLMLTLLILLVSSCKKEKEDPLKNVSTPVYSIKFKVDGLQKEYKIDANCLFNIFVARDNKYVTTISSSEKPNSQTRNTIALILTHSQAISSTKTFVNYGPTQNTPGLEESLWLAYYDENEVFYCSLGDIFTKLYGISSDGFLQFTEVADKYVKGTFKGTFYNDDHTKYKKITNGEFFVQAIRQ